MMLLQIVSRVLRLRLQVVALCGLLAGLSGAPGSASASTWSDAVPVTHQAPFALAGALGGVSCPSLGLCVATDNLGNVVSTTKPEAGTWQRASLVGAGVIRRPQTNLGSFGISCPSAELCVTLDRRGDVVSSTSPAGGPHAWHAVLVSRLDVSSVAQVSCPSRRLCVIVTDTGQVATSTDPTGAARAWKVAAVDSSAFSFQSVSCPSIRLCVAVASSGRVFTSTHPAGGRRAWRSRQVESLSSADSAFTGVSCPSTHLCVAVNGYGHVLFTRNPTGRSRVWRETSQFLSAASIACSSERFCVVGGSGDVAVSTHPTAGAGAWMSVSGFTTAGRAAPTFNAVACRSAALCVAVDSQGEAISSGQPTGGRSSWKLAGVDGSNPLLAVACPTASACVAATDQDSGPDLGSFSSDVPALNILASSTSPAGAVGSWSVSRGIGVQTLSCPTPSLCVGGDARGNITRTTDPTGPISGWSPGQVVGPQANGCGNGTDDCQTKYASISSLSCPNASLCAAFATGDVSGHSYYLSSSSPAGGGSTWKVDSSPNFAGNGISCPSESLCAAIGGADVATTSTPTNGRSWTKAPVDAAGLDGISCPSANLCVAVGNQGSIITSTRPGVAGSWQKATVDAGRLLSGVTCPTTSKCLAYDREGNVVTSSNPTSPTSWTVTNVDRENDLYGNLVQINAASCPAVHLCVLVDSVGNVITGSM